jgi:5'-3' exonuclease
MAKRKACRVVIDSNWFLYRMFYAQKAFGVRHATTTALHNFVAMCRTLQPPHPPPPTPTARLKVFCKTNPKQPLNEVICCFDHGQLERRALYPAYKCGKWRHRPGPLSAEAKKHVIAAKKEFVNSMSVCTLPPSLSFPVAFEADDAINTIVQDGLRQRRQVIIVSKDKDLFQLIDPSRRVFLYEPTVKAFIAPGDVKKRFGVRPEKMADLLALQGDSVDNLPGVKGIGAQSAIALLKQYGSVSALIKHRVLRKKDAACAKLTRSLVRLYDKPELVPIVDDYFEEKPTPLVEKVVASRQLKLLWSHGQRPTTKPRKSQPAKSSKNRRKCRPTPTR